MFEPYIQIAKSLTQLIKPLVEVVIHDLRTKKIVYIDGGLSLRQVGDFSLLDEDENNWQDDLENKVYQKLTSTGQLLKSTTIPIQHHGETVGLLCINYDISLFQNLQKLAALTLSQPLDEQPKALFKNDWQERIHRALHQILSDKGKKIDKMTFKEKKEVIYFLHQMGAFKGRHASDYVAEIMGIGRATIFKYLKQRKTKNDDYPL